MVERAKVFLTKQIGPFPVYAYVVVGALLLVGGVIYFKNKNVGKAAIAPQTNTNTSPDGSIPLPYPGAGAAGVPPSSAFDTSGTTSVPQYVSQSNFMPAPAEPTPSQAWAAPAAPPPNVDYWPAPQPLTVRLFEPIAPLLGNLLPGILTPNPPSVPPPYVPARSHPGTGALA